MSSVAKLFMDVGGFSCGSDPLVVSKSLRPNQMTWTFINANITWKVCKMWKIKIIPILFWKCWKFKKKIANRLQISSELYPTFSFKVIVDGNLHDQINQVVYHWSKVVSNMFETIYSPIGTFLIRFGSLPKTRVILSAMCKKR